MDLEKVQISEPRSRDLANHVDVTLTLESGTVIPFSASPYDSLSHGRNIYEKAIAGEYGEVTVAPSDELYIWVDGRWVLYSDTTTTEQKIAESESAKASLLATARETINEWQSELMIGTITDDDKAQLIKWLAYIKALKAVDTSTAPDITWPEVPAVSS